MGAAWARVFGHTRLRLPPTRMAGLMGISNRRARRWTCRLMHPAGGMRGSRPGGRQALPVHRQSLPANR